MTGLLLRASLVIAILWLGIAIASASTPAFILGATFCRTPARTDCTTTSFTVPLRSVESPEGWCESVAPIKAAADMAYGFANGVRAFLVPETLTCERLR